MTTLNYDETIFRAGVVLIDWCLPSSMASRLFDRVFEAAERRHPGVTFGRVDTQGSPRLAQRVGAVATPMITAYRDGTWVGSRHGVLTSSALDDLVEEAASWVANDNANARSGAV